MRTVLLLTTALALAVLAGCGGSGDGGSGERILHLDGVDVTEQFVSIYTHGNLTQNSKDAEESCKGAANETIPHLLSVIFIPPNGRPSYVEDGMPGYRERPGQVAEKDDELRAAEMVKEECERILQP